MGQIEKLQPIDAEELDRLIEITAKAAGYENGFGLKGCDIRKTGWWAAYTRQSLLEQSQNSRLPDYLRTCAQEAKKLGVMVPREYIFYDAVTGEHLERTGMIFLRRCMKDRRIAGVIFPALDRLSREPVHQGIFDLEASYYGVRVHYADAPSGDDPGSQFTRSILSHAAKLVKLANRKNARGGNIGRVLKGWVPANKAAYGYSYRRKYDIASDGRAITKDAQWVIDELGPDEMPVEGSPAWVVQQIFSWIGSEERSLYWVADKLNKMVVKAPQSEKWSPTKISTIVHRHGYTGNHAYNVNAKVPNPKRPIVNVTAEFKRTLKRPKPKEEWIEFKVPALVSEALWQKTNSAITERGRGSGKQGKSIQALLRNRIFCPECGSPMVVRRKSCQDRVYYHCSRYYRRWVDKPCKYSRFVPETWDKLVWDDICTMLREDAWIDEQLASAQSQDDNVGKLIRLEQFKISQAQKRIGKLQDGFEAGIYTLDEARRRLADNQATISKAEAEIKRLQEGMKPPASRVADIEAMREELRALRERHLDEATFENKLEIIFKLGIKVYPTEDLKSMRVVCRFSCISVYYIF